MKYLKKTKSVVSVSEESREQLEVQGKNVQLFVTKLPADPFGCPCKMKIVEELANSRREKTMIGDMECPRVKTDKGYGRYWVVCQDCDAVLGAVYSKNGKLVDYYDLHGYSWHDSRNWYGCLGINQNPDTMEVNFECCCGCKVIKEGRSNELRYSRYKTIKDEGDKKHNLKTKENA